LSKRNANNIAIIVAAGNSRRYGGEIPKQYLEITGKSILRLVVEKFNSHPDIDAVIVSVNSNYVAMYESAVSGIDLLPYVIGGETRQKSVYNALEKIKDYSPKKVLIHDVARILIDEDTISDLISALDKSRAVIPAVNIRDTVKYAENNIIKKTIPRDNLFLAQTPQAFEYETILNLHRKYSDLDFTDDSSICEHDGFDVSIVESSMLNFKITTKEDFELAKKNIR
jgi:2-C-methyl-D-erythritol 4-phosphate cytidylyltransferase / 2-C-methyl-D-erythritol 2,4-cyclodiphosphate synthase